MAVVIFQRRATNDSCDETLAPREHNWQYSHT